MAVQVFLSGISFKNTAPKIAESIGAVAIITGSKLQDVRYQMNLDHLKENKIKLKFPFFVMSYSKQNVIRGLHIQTKNSQGKLVTVIKGKIFDIALASPYI